MSKLEIIRGHVEIMLNVDTEKEAAFRIDVKICDNQEVVVINKLSLAGCSGDIININPVAANEIRLY